MILSSAWTGWQEGSLYRAPLLGPLPPMLANLPPPLAGEGRGRGLDHFLMSNPLPTRAVDLMKADVLAACRRVEADGNAHQPETDRAGPDGPRHTDDYDGAAYAATAWIN